MRPVGRVGSGVGGPMSRCSVRPSRTGPGVPVLDGTGAVVGVEVRRIRSSGECGRSAAGQGAEVRAGQERVTAGDEDQLRPGAAPARTVVGNRCSGPRVASAATAVSTLVVDAPRREASALRW